MRTVASILIALLVSFGTMLAYLPSLTHYGATWDELVFHRNVGRNYANFLRTRELSEIVKDDKSSWFPPVAVTVGHWFTESKFAARYYSTNTDRFHLAAVFFGGITTGIAFLIGLLLFNNVLFAFLSSLLLATHPQFVTQAHTNVRDVGLVMFYSFTLLLFLCVTKVKKNHLIWVAWAAIFAGITTAVKQNGAFLLPIGLIWFVINVKKIGWKKIIIACLIFSLYSFMAFFIFWPYLWTDTIRHLSSVWGFLTTPSIIAGSTTFYDKVYTSMLNIPIYYPWTMLFILTPLPLAILSALGLIVSLKRLVEQKPEGILFLWIFIALARFFFPKSSITYDQIRHFLEVLPVIPLSATLFLVTIYNLLSKKVFKVGVIFLGITAFTYSIYVNYKYQPYGTAYFNMFAGPPSYVNQAFDIEYWGNVYREASQHLNHQYGENVKYYSAGLGAHILVEDGLKGKLTDNPSDKFDYVIFMNKQTWLRGNSYVLWLLKNKTPTYTIERGGKVIFYLFEPFREEYLVSI